MTGRRERRPVGAQLVQDRTSLSSRLGAPGRQCGRAVLQAGRSLVLAPPPSALHVGKGGGSQPPQRLGGQPCLLCLQPGSPEPWSPRVACFPPWWSWAMLSPWPLCGTGAGGAGACRMSKVSAAGGYRPGCCHQPLPRPRGLEAGRGQAAASLPPLHFLVPSSSCP